MNNKSSEITIVYIEDSDDVRFACEQTLTLAGYRVISCCDAEHSIPLIQSQANIIILTDVRLRNIRTRAPPVTSTKWIAKFRLF